MAYDVRFISQADVESLGISMKEVMDGVETGWRMNGEGKTELPAKIGIHRAATATSTPCPAGSAAIRTWRG